MKKESYYCDLCKTEVDKQNQLIPIELNVKDHIHRSVEVIRKRYGDKMCTFNGWGKELCLPCAKKVGLIIKVDEAPNYNSPNLGNQLYDVVVGIVSEHFNLEE